MAFSPRSAIPVSRASVFPPPSPPPAVSSKLSELKSSFRHRFGKDLDKDRLLFELESRIEKHMSLHIEAHLGGQPLDVLCWMRRLEEMREMFITPIVGVVHEAPPPQTPHEAVEVAQPPVVPLELPQPVKSKGGRPKKKP